MATQHRRIAGTALTLALLIGASCAPGAAQQGPSAPGALGQKLDGMFFAAAAREDAVSFQDVLQTFDVGELCKLLGWGSHRGKARDELAAQWLPLAQRLAAGNAGTTRGVRKVAGRSLAALVEGVDAQGRQVAAEDLAALGALKLAALLGWGTARGRHAEQLALQVLPQARAMSRVRDQGDTGHGAQPGRGAGKPGQTVEEAVAAERDQQRARQDAPWAHRTPRDPDVAQCMELRLGKPAGGNPAQEARLDSRARARREQFRRRRWEELECAEVVEHWLRLPTDALVADCVRMCACNVQR